MAVRSNYYLNGISLASSTAVFDNDQLTIKAADGWYSDGVIVREQSSGLLLPQQNCGGDFVPIHISATGATSEDACAFPLTQYCYNDPVGGSFGIIGIGDTVYKDFCSDELLEDGYYNAVGSLIVTGYSWFRCINGIVTQIGYCGGCQGYTLFVNFGSGYVDYIDCLGQPNTAQAIASSGPETVDFCARQIVGYPSNAQVFPNQNDCTL